MNEFIFNALHALYNDRWVEDLLSHEFVHIHRVLAKREYAVLEMKVQLYEEGYEDKAATEEVARLLNLKLGTVTRVLYDIKHVFRHGLPRRVDNKLHPEIHRAKRKKERMRRNGYFGPNNQDFKLGTLRRNDRRETSES